MFMMITVNCLNFWKILGYILKVLEATSNSSILNVYMYIYICVKKYMVKSRLTSTLDDFLLLDYVYCSIVHWFPRKQTLSFTCRGLGGKGCWETTSVRCEGTRIGLRRIWIVMWLHWGLSQSSEGCWGQPCSSELSGLETRSLGFSVPHSLIIGRGLPLGKYELGSFSWGQFLKKDSAASTCSGWGRLKAAVLTEHIG